MTAVTFDRVSIVFGDAPERALPLMDKGLSRSEIHLVDFRLELTRRFHSNLTRLIVA